MDLQEGLKVILISATSISELRSGIPVATFRYDFRQCWALLQGLVIAAAIVTACCALGWEAHPLLMRG